MTVKMNSRHNINQGFVGAFSILIFLLMWASQSTSKVSLVSLLRLHKFEEIKSSTWYLSVCIILQAPHFLTVAHVIWKTSFINTAHWTKWPSMTRLILGVLASLLEVVSLCVFLVELAPLLPDQILLLLPGAVYTIPIIIEHIRTKNTKNIDAASLIPHSTDDQKFSKSSSAIKYITISIGLLSPAIISAILFTWSPYKVQLLHLLVLPTILLFISILWIPQVQVDIVSSSDKLLQGRWKTSLLYAIIKILAIPVCLGVILTINFQDLRSAYFVEFLAVGLRELLQFEVYFPIILIITSGFIVTFVGLIAVKVGLTTTVLFIASVLSTPTAIIISMVQCTSIPGPAAGLCKAHDLWVLISTLLSTLVWFFPLMICGSLFTRPTDVLLKPFDECFLHFTWTTLFLDQRLILNYYPNGLSYSQHNTPSMHQGLRLGSQVFICTTMYNEGDYEMKRLLQSLFRVAKSRKLHDVYIEIHIFLDNGSQNGRLNENARRLVNLVAILNKDTNSESMETLKTPYGIQMTWTLGENCLPFFMHIKDSEKFKAKKRWSQVMYMNYILNYRCKLVNTNKMASRMTSQRNRTMGFVEEKHNRIYLKGLPFRKPKETTENTKTSAGDSNTKRCYSKATFTGSERKVGDLCPHNMAAVLDSELERLRVLLNVRRCDGRFGNSCVISASRRKSASSRRSYPYQSSSSSEIAVSVSNILSLVLNGRCSHQCLNFSLTRKPFLTTTSEESSCEDEESAAHSEAYTVSGESSIPNGEACMIDGDTDAEVDDDEEEDLTDKSSSCDDRQNISAWNKAASIHCKRYLIRSDRKHSSCDKEVCSPSSETGSRKMGPKFSDVGGGYLRDAPLTVPTIPASNRNEPMISTANRNELDGAESSASVQDTSRDASESVTSSTSRDVLDSVTSSTSRDESETSSTYRYSFDLRPRPGKSESNDWTFQHMEHPNRHHRQRFWSPRRSSCNSSFCSSPLSSKSSSPRVDGRNDIFSITHEDSMNLEVGTDWFEQSDPSKGSHFDDQTYILATDADMDFDDSSVYQLLDLCNRDKRVGGACGRTRPIGQHNNPIVWYQKFEYAKDFWMIKSSQNVIGCVMCCPGCFSLYRADAVKEVMETYHQPTQSPFDVFIKDHGEDRWLCTLMMLNGWKLEYTPYSKNSTFCPDTFLEFLKQRKRWVLSEVSNLMLVFQNIRRLANQNASFSLIYIIYILQMFLLVILSPGTTIVVLTASLDILFGFSCIYTSPFCALGLVLYTIMCSTQPIRIQSAVTFALTIFLGILVLSVSAGYVHFIVKDTITDLQDGHLEFKQYYLLFVLMIGVLYSAFIHPKELPTLIHGLTFLLSFPAMYILLPFYAIANIVDQRWGTRDHENGDRICRVDVPGCFRQKSKINPVSQSKKDSIENNPLHLADRMDPSHASSLASGSTQQKAEHDFWEDLRTTILGRDVNLGINASTMEYRLKDMRNRFVAAILLLNLIWLTFLTTMYLVIPRHDNVFGIIACSIYSFSLVIQLVGLTAHKCDSIFRHFVIKTFGGKYPIWVHPQDKR